MFEVEFGACSLLLLRRSEIDSIEIRIDQRDRPCTIYASLAVLVFGVFYRALYRIMILVNILMKYPCYLWSICFAIFV